MGIILFLSAALSQQAVASVTEAPSTSAFAADTAAYVAVADICDVPVGEYDVQFKKLITAGSKVFLENCLQLRLQSSGFSLAFVVTSRGPKQRPSHHLRLALEV